MMQVTVPQGMSAGQQMIVQAPDGARMQVTLPPGLQAGQQFRLALPAAAEAADSSSASAARVGAQAAKRTVDANAKVVREKAEQVKADLEAAQKRTAEEAARKNNIRREAEVFKREMEALMTGGSADPSEMLSSTSSVATAEVPMAMPLSALPSAPSPIASVPGSLRRLADDSLQTIQPLLNEIKELLTFNKINRALAEWAAKPANRMKLSEAQASAVLDSVENQLRWPQALQTLTPALDVSARQWAAKITDDKCLDYDSQPKPW
jgi:hypothetical protein